MDFSEQQPLVLKRASAFPITVDRGGRILDFARAFSPGRVLGASKTDRPSRLQVALWGALLVVAALLSLRAYGSFQLGAYQDDANYTIIAMHLANPGKFASMDSIWQSAESRYPAGYPLLLSPFALLFPDNIDALKIPSIIATLLNGSLLFWGWRRFSRHKSYWWGLGIAALYLLSPLTIDHTRMVMSEPVFTFFVLASLILAEQMVHGSPGRWWSVKMCVLLFMAVFVRSVGSVLVLSIFAYLVLVKGRRIWRQLGLVILGLVFLFGFLMRVMPTQANNMLPLRYFNVLRIYQSTAQPGDTQVPYAGVHVSPWQLRFLQRHLQADIPGIVIPVGGSQEQAIAERVGILTLFTLLGLAATGLIAVGLCRWVVGEGLSSVHVFLILYVGVLLVWIWNGDRLLYPVQPQLQFAFLLGIEVFLLPLRQFAGRTPVVHRFESAALLLITLGLLSISVYRDFRIDDIRLHVGDLSARTQWLKSNTAVSDSIMTEQPETDFLYSGRRTVAYPTSCSSTNELLEYFAKNHITYVLVAPEVNWQLHYVPHLGRHTLNMLPCLESLKANNQLELAYASQTDLIQVFRTVP